MKCLGFWGVAAISLAHACSAAEEDPLSAESLQRVARAQGDAVGQEFAGDFILQGQRQDCDCPELDVVDGFDLCGVLGVEASSLPAQASQHEGLIVVEISGTIALLGGVDDDGSFAAASILDASVINVGGEILSFFEGAFDDDGFTGELTNRFVGTIMGEAIDCRANSLLTAVRISGS
ncbi:MAG TPA: hypothetical protein ENJ18_07195 [Nannocystis exedens]|nr:hypothetical protein [Nannocystis exedens]